MDKDLGFDKHLAELEKDPAYREAVRIHRQLMAYEGHWRGGPDPVEQGPDPAERDDRPPKLHRLVTELGRRYTADEIWSRVLYRLLHDGEEHLRSLRVAQEAQAFWQGGRDPNEPRLLARKTSIAKDECVLCAREVTCFRFDDNEEYDEERLCLDCARAIVAALENAGADYPDDTPTKE